MKATLYDLDSGPDFPRPGPHDRRNPHYDEVHCVVHSMDGIFAHVRREIERFFTIYKELEG